MSPGGQSDICFREQLGPWTDAFHDILVLIREQPIMGPGRPENPLQGIQKSRERAAPTEQIEVVKDRSAFIDRHDKPASEEISTRPPDQCETRQQIHMAELDPILRRRLAVLAHVLAASAGL